jgi:hypothetical protein
MLRTCNSYYIYNLYFLSSIYVGDENSEREREREQEVLQMILCATHELHAYSIIRVLKLCQIEDSEVYARKDKRIYTSTCGEEILLAGVRTSETP